MVVVVPLMTSLKGLGFNENETEVAEHKFLYPQTETLTTETLGSSMEYTYFLLERHKLVLHGIYPKIFTVS